MRRATSRRATTDSARVAARQWMKNPENRRRAREAVARHRALGRDASSRERENVIRRFGREIARMAAAPRKAMCAICATEFDLNHMGRPRKYCEMCVKKFARSTRKCPGCDATMPAGGRRLTCRSCGALWGRKGDGKV